MKLLGTLFIIISIFIIYKRLTLILFGKTTNGYIIGFGDCIKGTRGIETYSYKIKYEYKGKEYIAYSLESASTSNGSVLSKNLNRKVKIYFKENNPKVVTIKEFKGTTIIGFAFLILGILAIIL